MPELCLPASAARHGGDLRYERHSGTSGESCGVGSGNRSDEISDRCARTHTHNTVELRSVDKRPRGDFRRTTEPRVQDLRARRVPASGGRRASAHHVVWTELGANSRTTPSDKIQRARDEAEAAWQGETQ